MLFLTESDFIDVVKEEQFDDVVTVSASSPLALAKFKHHSENEIVVNTDNFAFPFAVYVTRESAASAVTILRQKIQPGVTAGQMMLNISGSESWVSKT